MTLTGALTGSPRAGLEDAALVSQYSALYGRLQSAVLVQRSLWVVRVYPVSAQVDKRPNGVL